MIKFSIWGFAHRCNARHLYGVRQGAVRLLNKAAPFKSRTAAW